MCCLGNEIRRVGGHLVPADLGGKVAGGLRGRACLRPDGFAMRAHNSGTRLWVEIGSETGIRQRTKMCRAIN